MSDDFGRPLLLDLKCEKSFDDIVGSSPWHGFGIRLHSRIVLYLQRLGGVT